MTPSEFFLHIKNPNPPALEGVTTVTGSIKLRSLSFETRIDLDQFIFEELVDFEDCRFARLVQFTNCVFRKGLVLRHAIFRGPLTVCHCEIYGSDSPASFENLSVDGQINFTGLRVNGDLKMSDLCCGAALLLNGATIDGDISAASACIKGELNLGAVNDWPNAGPKSVTYVSGRLNLSQSSIGSQIAFTGAEIGAVDLEQSKIGGTIFCHSSKFTMGDPSGPLLEQPLLGSLFLFGATVHGNIELKKAVLKSGLNLSSSEVRGNLFFEKSCLGKTAKSSLRMVGAHIRGAARFEKVSFTGRFEATNCTLGVLELDGRTLQSLRRIRKTLKAQGCESEQQDEEAFSLDLSGATFGDLGLPKKVRSRIPRSRLYKPWSWKWTKRTTKLILTDNVFAQMLELTKLDERSYRGVENWLRRQGYDYEADSVCLRASSRKIHEIKESRWWNLHRWWNCIWLHVIGWGLIRRWLAIALLVSFAVTLVFCTAESIRNPRAEATAKFSRAINKAINDRVITANAIVFMAPKLALDQFQPQTSVSKETMSNDSFWALVSLGGASTEDSAPRTWGDHAWVMFRTALPMLAGIGPKNWEPSRNTLLGIRYESIAAVVSAVNWVFLPLLVASFAGFLKKRDS